MDTYVDQLMSSPVETVRANTPLRAAAGELLAEDVGALVVVDDDIVAGILTATDFVRFVDAQRSVDDATVADAMRTDVVTTTPDTEVRDIAATMLDHRIDHVPVLDSTDDLVGMLSTTDLAAHLRSRW